MNANAIQKRAKIYVKRMFGQDLDSLLYLGKDEGMEGYIIYEFKVFLKDRREFYLNIIEIPKGEKAELVYDLTPKD